MAQPYVGEIRLFAGNFAPVGWAFCDGQLLPISENETLYQLIGTTYGGDGEETFAMPDLRGRIPIHMGTNTATNSTFTLAETGGAETVALSINQMPGHSHPLVASTSGGTGSTPQGNVLAQSPQIKAYIEDAPGASMNGSVGSTGGSQPHENRQPFVCINYIISLFGIFPSPT